jgi:hypothetical protein
MIKISETTPSYASCDLVQQATKIHSSIKFLDPSKTCEVEMEIINNSHFQIACLQFDPESGRCISDFYFHVEDELYEKFLPWQEIIQEHLTEKSLSVLKYFPHCKLSKVEVRKKQG